MKPDPRRLELGWYPFVAEIPARFADIDFLGHLNNVAIANLYEEGRVMLHRSLGMRPIREDGSLFVVVQVLINYLGEGTYPAELKVAGGVSRIGGASYTIAQGLFQDGRCIGTADSVIVGSRDGRSFPLPDDIRAGLSTLQIKETSDG